MSSRPPGRAIRRLFAVMLGVVALALPPATVTTLAGPDMEKLGQLVLGVWIFKALLLLHAVLLWQADRILGGAPVDEAPRSLIHSDRGAFWTLIVVLIAAAVLRVYRLGDGLWYDEIWTLVEHVRLPLTELVVTLDHKNHHMLYSLTANVTVFAFGDNEWSLRLPAALFGVGSVAAVYWLGLQVTRTREALFAAALLAFSYHHVWFSQNARGYTGLLLWTIIASGLFVRLLSDERSRRRGFLPVLYGAAVALAAYTHASAVVLGMAHLAIAVWWWWRKRPEPAALRPVAVGLLLAVTFTLQLYALVLPQMVETLLRPSVGGVGDVWKSPLWMITEMANGLQRGLPGGWLTLAAGMFLITAGVVSYVRQSVTVAAVFLLPGVLTAVLALLVGQNLWPRFFFFCAGFAALIVMRGISVSAGLVSRTHQRQLATAFGAVLIAASAVTVPRAWLPKQDFHAAARFIDESMLPGDAVVTVDMSVQPFRTYLGRDWLEVENEAGLREVERNHARTWVLYTFPTRLADLAPRLWARVRSSYTRIATFPGTVTEGEIVVLMKE